jgi:hypothetical protein
MHSFDNVLRRKEFAMSPAFLYGHSAKMYLETMQHISTSRKMAGGEGFSSLMRKILKQIYI